jgi:hypothetical protein
VRTVLRTAMVMLAASLVFTATAQAGVVSGSVTDPAGDGVSPLGVHPSDLASFSLSYDDAGALTASYGVHDDQQSGTWVGFRAEARIGVWSSARNACDTTSAGGASLTLRVTDQPPELIPNVSYTVVGFNGGAEREIGITAPQSSPNVWSYTFQDAAAFAQRGYNCVDSVALANDGDGSDTASATFCMGPSGTVSCADLGEPLGIRWTSPTDGQTVSGFLHEGAAGCLAAATGPVVRTENLVDGVVHDVQANAPWGCEIDTRELSDGPHTLTVRAFTADGRSVEHTVRVTVANRVGGGTSSGAPTGSAGSTAAPGATTPSSAGSDAPVSSGAAGAPAGGAPTAAAGEVVAPRGRLSAARAAALGRRALAKRFGRAYTKRAKAGDRMTCEVVTARRAVCRVAWRHRAWRYSGTVRVRRVDGRDTAVVRVTRHRAPAAG